MAVFCVIVVHLRIKESWCLFYCLSLVAITTYDWQVGRIVENAYTLLVTVFTLYVAKPNLSILLPAVS
jgi:hypothetical protein